MKRKQTASFGTPLPGFFSVFQTPDYFLPVVNDQKMEIAGYMVPKEFAALYQLVTPLAQTHQLSLGIEGKPTELQIFEVFKRVVKRLGVQLSDIVWDEVKSVMTDPEWEKHTEDPWDYEAAYPDSARLLSVADEDDPFECDITQENTDDNDSEEETCSGGDDDL